MNDEFIDYPFTIGSDGKTAICDEDDHIHDLIEQVLFTNPGERVNMPEFGCGLKQLIFAPNNDILATVTEVTVNSALRKWLGHLIKVDTVFVKAEEEKLIISIHYIKLRTQEKYQVQFIK